VASSSANVTDGGGPYDDTSGGRTVRVLDPCTDDSCNWYEDTYAMPINRWYPSLETLPDGDMIVIGGEMWGGFVTSDPQYNVPTYEFWPERGEPVNCTFLVDTMPANLYPLTWLLPNGLIFMQANWQTTLLNYTTAEETRLPNITHAQKTYPASGATTMMPLDPASNYSVNLLFCGGMDPEIDSWDPYQWDIVNTDTSSSCVSINPMDPEPTWIEEDNLPENRGMGNFIILPDTRLFLANGVAKGSAGYGNFSWPVNQSFAQDPVLRPAYYDSKAESGSRWVTDGLPESTIGRLYHSSATLLPDGSVFIAGSNPNADVITEENNPTYVYKTEYRAEIFYPDYYDAGRPNVTGAPEKLTYGGDYFDIELDAASLNGTDLSTIIVSVMRTGFSTHSMNMGMRQLILEHSYTGYTNGSATLHVAMPPPNAALLVPGPVLFFVTVNGIPSYGTYAMLGSGVIETQTMLDASVLPASSGNFKTTTASSTTSSAKKTSTGSAANASNTSGNTSGAGKLAGGVLAAVAGLAAVLAF
jgi:hypothetical protein